MEHHAVGASPPQPVSPDFLLLEALVTTTPLPARKALFAAARMVSWFMIRGTFTVRFPTQDIGVIPRARRQAVNIVDVKPVQQV